MNFAQLYSLTLGQKIDRIYTLEKYYPLQCENYIVVQPFSKPAKNYDYMADVLGLLYPHLEKAGIKIVQVGAANEPSLPNCLHTQGTTNWGNLEYIISKAKLVLSIDSIAAHLAWHYNVPLVVLISNNFKECVAPYFGDKSKQIILEPDRTKKNPSFMLDEGPNKQVNEIKPELIAQSVLNLLSIDARIGLETIFIGGAYRQTILSCVPDQVIAPTLLANGHFEVRLDWEGTEDNVYQQAARARCHIFTDRALKLDILTQLKPNIVAVTINLDKYDDLNFIKAIRALGLPFGLLTTKKDEELGDLKLKYCDYGIIQQETRKTLDSIPNHDKISAETWFKTNKLLLSNGRVFPSKAHFLANLPCEGLEKVESKVIMSPEFFNESDFHWYHNKS